MSDSSSYGTSSTSKIIAGVVTSAAALCAVFYGIAQFQSAIQMKEIATPANPPSGYHDLYFKTDHSLYSLDASGTEAAAGGGGGGATSPLTLTANNDSELPLTVVQHSDTQSTPTFLLTQSNTHPLFSFGAYPSIPADAVLWLGNISPSGSNFALMDAAGDTRINGSSSCGLWVGASQMVAVSSSSITDNLRHVFGSYTLFNGISTPSVSASGTGRMHYDSSADKLMVSENGGSYDFIAKQHVTINAQTSSYTLTLADDAALITLSNATAHTLTIPTNASVAFPKGTQITVIQIGAGQFDIIAGTPGTTTVASNGGTSADPKLRVQYSAATLVKVDTDVWYVSGDIQ